MPGAMDNISFREFRRNQLRLVLPRLFGQMEQAGLMHMEKYAEWIQLAAGEVLCREGDAGDCLYLIVTGRICAVKNYGRPDEKRLNILGRGEILGEIAFLTGGCRSATLFAMRDSELLKISRFAFETLTDKVPHAFFAIGQTLARRMLRIEAARAGSLRQNLAVIHFCMDDRLKAFLMDFTRALYEQVPVFHLSRSNLENRFGVPGIAEISKPDPLNIRLTAWLNEQESKNKLLVYEADPVSTDWTRRCLREADKVLVFIPAEKQPCHADQEMISLLRGERPGLLESELIFLHGKTVPHKTGTGQWLNAIPSENHYHLRYGSKTDLQHLIRCLTGNAVNLVLSGGAACGLAHIGVIRALEENRIPIDTVSGTSVGAVIAAQYAMGMRYSELLESNRFLWVTSKPMRDATFPMISCFRGRRLEEAGRTVFGDIQIEDLWLPFFCVSTSLTSADQVIHRKGPLFKALRASSSVPGLVPPVVIDNEVLVDGGILNNLPVNIARRLYNGSVIAVDVTEARRLRISGKEFPSSWNMLCRRMLPPDKRGSIPGITEIIYHSAIVGSQRRTEQAGREADYYLRLPLDRFKFLEFGSFDRIVELGYRFSKTQIQAWKGITRI